MDVAPGLIVTGVTKRVKCEALPARFVTPTRSVT